VITAADVQRVAKILTEVGPAEILRGVRRAMAQNMTLAQREVAAATVTMMPILRLGHPAPMSRSVWCVRWSRMQCRTGLNAWFESRTLGRRVLKKIDVGIAVDLPDGLFVPVLRDVANRDAADIRRGLDRLRAISWRVGSHRKKCTAIP